MKNLREAFKRDHQGYNFWISKKIKNKKKPKVKYVQK